MMIKKVFAFLLILLISLSVISCSSGSTGQTISETSHTVTETRSTVTEKASSIIKADQLGGTFPNSNSSVVLTFAAGSVNTSTTIKIIPVSNFLDAPGYIPGTTYAFESDGTNFYQAVQLTIKYDPANIPISLPETMLCLAKLAGNSWQPVKDSKVDTSSKSVTGSVTGFSTYGLIGSNMTVTFDAPACFPGTEVTITPQVVNAPPGYKLEYKWSYGEKTGGKYGELLGTPDEKSGAIKYRAKVDAPDGSTENITLEIFTYFATADTPPKYTHYTWLTATTTVSMGFPTFSVESRTIAPREETRLTPMVQNAPPGYKLMFKWNSDQKYGTLTPNADGTEAVYKANADAPDGVTENINVEMYSQFSSGGPSPVITDYIWHKATATITIGILSFKFNLVQTMPGVQGEVLTRVWVKNHKVKMVTSGQAGAQVVHLFDYDTHVEYWYTGNEGHKTAIDPSQKSPDDPHYLIQFAQYKKIGTEKVDGVLCRVMQSDMNGTTTKVWIWEERNLPKRMQVKSSQGTATFEYRDYEFISIPDDEFILPPNITIR